MLLFLFVLLPITEFTVLYLVGREIGVLNLIAAVFVAAVLGATIAQTRGFRQWREWQQSVSAGKMPEDGVIGGILILAACLFLVLPGFVSDVLALGLLIPPIRKAVGNILRRRFAKGVKARRIHLEQMGQVTMFPTSKPGEKEIGGERLDDDR